MEGMSLLLLLLHRSRGRSPNSFQNETLPCPESCHLEPPPLPTEASLAATAPRRAKTPPKINVLIKPGKRQADYSPAPSQGRAGENKPVLIVLAAPPLPLQSPTHSEKPPRALCSCYRWVTPTLASKTLHPSRQSQNIPCEHRHPA